MIPSPVLPMQRRKIAIILMAGKDLGILSRKRTIDKSQKTVKIRHVRHAKKYMFGYLMPRNHTEALEFDKVNNNSKWYDATEREIYSIHSYDMFKKHKNAQYDKPKKVVNAPQGYQII